MYLSLCIQVTSPPVFKVGVGKVFITHSEDGPFAARAKRRIDANSL